MNILKKRLGELKNMLWKTAGLNLFDFKAPHFPRQ